MGKLHESSNKPCQDYAITAVEKDYAVAVVSDGCSSGGLTDVGARIVAHAAKKHASILLGGRSPAEFVNAVFATMCTAAEDLNLTKNDLLATLMIAISTQENTYVYFFGDGACQVKYRSSPVLPHQSLHRFAWEKNTPYYIAYGNEELAYDTFVKAHGHYGAPALTETISSEFGESTAKHQVLDGINGLKFTLLTSSIESIALFTDGIEQVSDKTADDVASSLTVFKNTTGDFVKRRLSKQVAAWKKDGVHPMDDISMAVIHINHEKEDVA